MQAWKAWFNETNNDLTINVIGEFTSTPKFDLCLAPRYPGVMNTDTLVLDVQEIVSDAAPLKQPRLVHFCTKVNNIADCKCVQVCYKGEVIADLSTIQVVRQHGVAETTLL